MATGEGLCRLDGQAVEVFTTEDSLADNFIKTLYQPKQSNRLFIGHNNGGITLYNHSEFIPATTEEVVNAPINSFCESATGEVYALGQNGVLLGIDQNQHIKIFELFKHQALKDLQFYSIKPAGTGKCLIATDNGAFVFELDIKNRAAANVKPVPKLDGINVSSLNSIENSPLDYLATTADGNLYQVKYFEEKWNVRAYDFPTKIEAPFNRALISSKGEYWIASYAGAIRIKPKGKGSEKDIITIYNTNNGLPSNYVQTIMEDREGNIWMGTYGEGLCLLEDEFFVFYKNNHEPTSNSVSAFYFEDTVKWFGLANGLLKIAPSTDQPWKFWSDNNGFVNDYISAIESLGNNLYIGTSRSGVFKLNKQTGNISAIQYGASYLSKSVNDLKTTDNQLWIATKDGLFKKDFANNETSHYNTQSGLLHNNILDILITTRGNVLVSAPASSIMHVHGDNVEYIEVSDEFGLLEINDMVEDGKGEIWVSTLGSGIFHLREKGSTRHFGTKYGLKSDFCYSLVLGNDHDLWIGHRAGLSKMDIKRGKVTIYSKEHGIQGDANTNAAYKDNGSNLWFGFTTGAVKYDPSKFSADGTSPTLVLKSLQIGEKKHPTNTREIIVEPGAYRVKFEYVGISFKQANKISYQYYLEGNDLEWSEPVRTTEVVYPKLEDGEYEFRVKACLESGECSEEIALIRVEIETPFWKSWWFLLLCFMAVGLLVFAYIKYRERENVKRVKYLDSQLAIRTKEVLSKNKQLEVKNRDITDSITYAKRIQNAMLPNLEAFHKTFPNSFIFYQPKDIVSGDFYWMTQKGDDFLLACVDCTGHGVPGGFMSMIGNTLLNDITSRTEIVNPGELLLTLDAMVKESLGSDEGSKVGEGMDLGFFAINLKQRKLVYSGAMRPFVLQSKKGVEVVAGTKHSIGGAFEEEKHFEEVTCEINSGDRVFVFSDGYQDQFGGPKDKKIGIKGLLSTIEENKNKPLKEIEAMIKSTFFAWKGSQDQIDDVLVIGFEIP